jgi:carbamate kinase
MLVVAALGGNALQRRGEPLDDDRMERNVASAAGALAMLATDHRVVVTHGNGPQIGLLALQAEAYRDVRTYPLDVLGAESEGMIGYLLERELANASPDRRVASLLTQTVVDALDPAFRRPSKPIGPMYTASEAEDLAGTRGWTMDRDGDGWRRVVASPMPRSIIETPTIELLLEHDVLVVCAGGGGVPVVVESNGVRHGVEAVVDKDAASALLARSLRADVLLLLTDVPCVDRRHGTNDPGPIGAITARELSSLPLAAGSMAPKAAAAATFVRSTGGRAAIGALEDAAALVAGTTGTQVYADVTAAAPVRSAP